MMILQESRVLQACQVLFGKEVRVGLDFLYYLQPSGVKAAYRRRAKEVHPDLYHKAPGEVVRRNAERFRELTEAHTLLCEFFRQRDAGEWRPQPRPRRVPPHRPATAKSSPRQGCSRNSATHFFHGQLPQTTLNIGRFCYYRGVVPYATLIEALSWQRRQRPVIGEIARRWGWLSDEGVRQVFALRDLPGKFGERAVTLGLLTPRQVQDLLYYQRARQQRLGRYFVEQGLVSEEEMARLVEEMRRHNTAMNSGGSRGPRRG